MGSFHDRRKEHTISSTVLVRRLDGLLRLQRPKLCEPRPADCGRKELPVECEREWGLGSGNNTDSVGISTDSVDFIEFYSRNFITLINPTFHLQRLHLQRLHHAMHKYDDCGCVCGSEWPGYCLFLWDSVRPRSRSRYGEDGGGQCLP